MSGCTIDEAKAAYCATLPHQQSQTETQPTHASRPASNSAHVATSPAILTPSSPPTTVTTSSSTVFVNGLPYVPDSGYSPSTTDSAHITEVHSNYADFPYCTCLALCDNTFSDSFSAFNVSSTLPLPALSPSLSSLPFIIDTGATCHISPILLDFQSLTPITPHPIKGLCDHSINAVGMGTIVLKTTTGTLTLQNAFFVPNSAVCLISVFLLSDANYSAHFYPHEGHCFISNAQNTVIACGKALSNRKLFILSDFSVHISPSTSPTSSAHYASRSPDIDTWHKRLGHCGSHTIIDMARSHAVEGMPIDTSSPPSKCEHCILGKQTCSSVLNVREGARATTPLERVYVDLCGPMFIPSRSGRLYSMNIIDDYSSFVWSLPLHSKDEAAPMLQTWLTALEVQTSHHLRSFVPSSLTMASSPPYGSTIGVLIKVFFIF